MCHEDVTINPRHIKLVCPLLPPEHVCDKGKNHFNGILRIQFINFIYSVKFMPLIITCDVNKRHSQHTPKNDNHLSQFHMKEFLSEDNFRLTLLLFCACIKCAESIDNKLVVGAMYVKLIECKHFLGL